MLNCTITTIILIKIAYCFKGRSTKAQRLEVKRISREIEIARFKTKLLSQEKDKKSAHLRQLKQKHNVLTDENEERSIVNGGGVWGAYLFNCVFV